MNATAPSSNRLPRAIKARAQAEMLAKALHMPLAELRRLAADAGIEALVMQFQKEGEITFPVTFSVKTTRRANRPPRNVIPFFR